ncbi:MAG: ferrous iron transport protein B [Fibrobacterota bacterium]
MSTPAFLLTGNPNCGKTTLFNALTGARQHTGNWSGVTIDIKEGEARLADRSITIIDLPGTYSITPKSPEEEIALNCLFSERAQGLVNVVDATNLERNLYLTVQLLETGKPLVMALNMSDELESRGLSVDTVKLGRLLGVPVVPTIGRTGEGLPLLLETALRTVDGRMPGTRPVLIPYGNEIEEEIARLEPLISGAGVCLAAPARWYALRLLEGDPRTSAFFRGTAKGPELLALTEARKGHLEKIFKDDPAAVITERRYGFITGALRETLTVHKPDRVDMTRRMDSVFLNPIFAYLIFGGLMWALFLLTFKLGALPMAWIQAGIAALSDLAGQALPDGLFKNLLIEGVLAGAGSVLVFMPNILILFFGISMLEDTGYMARAAFLMDKVMHKMGLHGKSFIPMVMGLGCNVPAILAARTLEARSDRILTILVAPLITCSARLPIYVLFAGAFFPQHAGNMVFLIYVLSFAFTFASGLLLRKIFFRDAEYPFVMELPPYRMPTLRSVAIHMWEKGKHYLVRIGRVIFVFSIVLFFLSHYPSGHRGIGETYIGRIGRAVEPLLAPAGFDLKMSISLLTGFVAKEMVVGTLAVLYSAEEPGEGNAPLSDSLRAHYPPLTAFGFMLFCLLYTPCLAALTTMVRELRSRRWSWFGFLYPIVLAWLTAVGVHQIGRLLWLHAS